MNYTIVIRTIGTGGAKYQALLNSIAKLDIKPAEVIVVLPEEYTLPSERLGWEIFVYSKKGMVQQRIYGANIAKSEYLLILDDDLEFKSDIIQHLLKPIEDGFADVTFPPQFSFFPPKKGIKKLIPWIAASACPTIFHKNMYTYILRSGGWSYNYYNENSCPEYFYSHSAPGTCCFTRKETFLNINFQDELWLQDVKYPLWEDQVMFFKFWESGYKVACSTKAHLLHLDAGKDSSNRKVDAAYSNSRNKIIFWERFIFSQENKMLFKLLDILALNYSFVISILIGLLESFISIEKKNEYKAFKKGIRDGKKFISSNTITKFVSKMRV